MTLRKQFSDFEQIVFGRVVKTAFYLLRRAVCFNEVSDEIWFFHSFFMDLSEQFLDFEEELIRNLQNCMIFVQGNVLGEGSSNIYNAFIFFGI